MATEDGVVITDPLQRRLDRFRHGGAGPLTGRGRLAVAPAEADRRELLGDGVHLRTGALGPPGIVETFGFVQLVAQLAEPLLVGRLRRPIEHRQAVAGLQSLVSAFGSRAVLPRSPTCRLQPLVDEIQHMELPSRVAQEVGDVAQALRVLHAAHRALIGEGPEVALVTVSKRPTGRGPSAPHASLQGKRLPGLTSARHLQPDPPWVEPAHAHPRSPAVIKVRWPPGGIGWSTSRSSCANASATASTVQASRCKTGWTISGLRMRDNASP